MVYVRGAREDYESWEAVGNTGWGWDDVLRSYRAMGDTEAGANGSEPAAAACAVRAKSTFIPFHIKSALASCFAGLSLNEDFNGATQEGVGAYQYTTRNGQRMSAARAFLRPAMKRRNMRVVTHAQVTKVLFEGTRATGVEYVHQGVTKAATARREVIFWLAGPSTRFSSCSFQVSDLRKSYRSMALMCGW